jgi:hypothetical protein
LAAQNDCGSIDFPDGFCLLDESWLNKAERLLTPRLVVIARPPMEYVTGIVCLVMAVILFLPIPLGNMLPALAICLLSLGVLERDGICVLAGMATAILSTVLVSGIVYALLKSTLFFLARMFNL